MSTNGTVRTGSLPGGGMLRSDAPNDPNPYLWQAEVDRSYPEWIVDRAVIVLDLRIARHHHALEAQILDALKV